MKEWEIQIATERKKRNTYVVVSDNQAFLCTKINNEFRVKDKSNSFISNYSKVTRL